MLKFELVLPAYNEAKNLPDVLKNAVDAAKKFNFTPNDFQLVLVNNGSTDNSKEILENCAQQDFGKWFRVVNVDVNQGYGYGIRQGLLKTTAPIIGWSHADRQCDLNKAFEAFAIVEESPSTPKLVKGIRRGRDWKDRIVSRVYEFLSRIILGVQIYEMNAQPKVFPRSLFTKFINPPSTFAFDLYVLYQAQKYDYTIQTIPVDFPPRIHGTSHWAATFISKYKTILKIIFYMMSLARTEGRL